MIKIFLIYSILCVSVLSGCKKTDDSMALKGETKRTVLMYMFQDSNLWDALTQNINDVEQGWVDGTDGTMLIYVDASTHITQFGGKPVLLEIKHDNTPLIVSKVVKVYEDKDATNVDVFNQVQKDVIEMYPAQSYGLIFSGHGEGFFVQKNTKSLSGSNRWSKNRLAIDVIAKNLAAHYQFLIFDACLMGETTTLYQLRNGVDFVVASPELSPGDGFAYRNSLSSLYTQPVADLYTFAKQTAYYFDCEAGRASLEEYKSYFSLGVYRLSEAENVAAVTKKAIETLNLKYNQLYSAVWEIIKDPARETPTSMYYPFDATLDKVLYYDMGLLIELLSIKGHKTLATELSLAVGKFMIQQHFAFTDVFSTANPNFENYTKSLSFYLPSHTASLRTPNDEAFYNRFEWSAASGFTSKWEN